MLMSRPRSRGCIVTLQRGAVMSLIGYLRRYGAFLVDYARYKRAEKRFVMVWKDRYPCLKEKTPTSEFDRHHTLSIAWAARKLAELRPRLCVDISSSTYFVTLVSAFVPMRSYDYRPATIPLSGLTCDRADLNCLPFPSGSIDTLTCLHVLEHVGLGRYGDPIDPQGDVRAAAELARVIAPGGSLILTVPVGRRRIVFNADRVYSYRYLRTYFNDLTLREFTLITDAGDIVPSATEQDCDTQEYGCGCFWFVRPVLPDPPCAAHKAP